MPSNIQRFRVLRAVSRAAAAVRAMAPYGVVRLGAAMAIWAVPLAAQESAGDSAWRQGRMGAARSAYQQALLVDSTAFRPNLRLGKLLSRQGRHTRALRYIARARAANAGHTEARLLEAQVMAWAGRYGDAIARYDSMLAADPGSVDARLGRARARAWLGDRIAADHDYRAVLAAEPTNADALVGLGYLDHWQRREASAERLARQALAADSAHQAARELLNAVHAASRTVTELSGDWSNDSDHNTVLRQRLEVSSPLSPGVRAFGGVTVRELSDRVRDATATGGEAGLTVGPGRFQLTGAGGAWRLTSDAARGRTAASYRGRLYWQPGAGASVGVGYARAPFDEIAALIERALDQEALEGGIDVRPTAGLSLRGGGGVSWISDGNRRTGADLAITQTVLAGVFVGAYGRALRYARPGVGYFSPDRFRLLEATAGYVRDFARWSGRLSGGLGAQRIGRGGDARTAWHLEGRFGRRWGAGNRVDLFGSVTNNAFSSTTGAFRSRTAGVLLRIGL